jgi:hypothetical protein
MADVVKTFADERGDAFPYAYCKLRVGEDADDTDRMYDHNDAGLDLIDNLYDRMDIRRELQLGF